MCSRLTHLSRALLLAGNVVWIVCEQVDQPFPVFAYSSGDLGRELRKPTRYPRPVRWITGKSARYCLLIGLFLYLLPQFASAQRKEFIFAHAPFASAHASTLVELRDGRYMAAWFGGTAEGATDVAVWASFRSAGGWSRPQQMAREPQVPCWNPVPFHAANGRLWLYYKFGPTYTWWTAARRYSDDEGKTWSPVQHLPAGLIGPVRTKPLLLPSGVLVSGSSVESYNSWAAWVEISRDNGDSWQSVGPITLAALEHAAAAPDGAGGAPANPSGMIQPTIIPMGGAHLRLYARASLDIGHICVADSSDYDGTGRYGDHPPRPAASGGHAFYG